MSANKLKRNPLSYSLWLIPDGKLFLELQSIIHNLSSAFEGIRFIPHVTLLSGFQDKESILLNRTEAFVKHISTFNVNLKEIEFSDEFFRTFFIKVDFDSDFKKAREIACSEFLCNDDNFIPHLSLAYGLKELSLKKNIKKNIKNNFKKFRVDKIYLAYNDEINYKWKVIQQFSILK